MSALLKPEIHWHYSGKLLHQLVDAACEQSISAVVAALQSQAQERCCLLVPTTAEDAFEEALRRRFKAESLNVFAADLRDGRRHTISTVYETEDTAYRLAYYRGSAAAFAEQLPANTFFRKLFTNANKSAAPIVMLAVIIRDRYNSTKSPAPVEECRSLARIAAERGYQTQILPEPGLSRDVAIKIINTAPSRILDGSHAWEKELEKKIVEAAESSPVGRAIQNAWHDLKSGTHFEMFVESVFEARVASLGELARAYPWEAIIDLWREVLRGLESDTEYAGRWYAQINAIPDGWLKLKDIDDILLYESSIYACHALVDPACVSYLVTYHGSRWLHRRMALASFFGGRGGDPPAIRWE